MISAHDFKRFLGLDRFMSVEVTLILNMDKVRSMVNKETTPVNISLSAVFPLDVCSRPFVEHTKWSTDTR